MPIKITQDTLFSRKWRTKQNKPKRNETGKEDKVEASPNTVQTPTHPRLNYSRLSSAQLSGVDAFASTLGHAEVGMPYPADFLVSLVYFGQDF